jgi:drug/metabolite transporter (DMT)-like permease
VPLAALVLALAAAVVHAGWNVLLGRARDPEAALGLALPVGVALFAAPALFAGGIGARAVPYLAASCVFEFAYLALLAAAYRRAEVSLVYPIARGVAPVLVLAGAVTLAGHGASAAEVLGIALVAAGVVLVRGLRAPARAADVAFACLTAVTIAGYTLCDKEGLRHADPLPYIVVELGTASLAYLWVITRIKGSTRVRAEAGWVTPVVGFGMVGGYLLVLLALRLAPAASVAAVRESSIVITTLLAGPLLGEAVGRGRLAGAVLVAGGVAAVALG